MRVIPRINEHAQGADHEALAATFAEIERRARLAGRVDVLMALDRLPSLHLGASNRVSDGAELMGLGASFEALAEIKKLLQSTKSEGPKT